MTIMDLIIFAVVMIVTTMSFVFFCALGHACWAEYMESRRRRARERAAEERRERQLLAIDLTEEIVGHAAETTEYIQLLLDEIFDDEDYEPGDAEWAEIERLLFERLNLFASSIRRPPRYYAERGKPEPVRGRADYIRMAFENADLAVARRLYDYGYDVDARCPHTGQTAMHAIYLYGDRLGLRSLERMRPVVEYFQPDLDAQDDDGYTALHLAAFQAERSAVTALLELGADASVCDAKGHTALMLMVLPRLEGHSRLLERAYSSDENIVGSTRALIDHGCPIHAVDNAGRNMMDHCVMLLRKILTAANARYYHMQLNISRLAAGAIVVMVVFCGARPLCTRVRKDAPNSLALCRTIRAPRDIEPFPIVAIDALAHYLEPGQLSDRHPTLDQIPGMLRSVVRYENAYKCMPLKYRCWCVLMRHDPRGTLESVPPMIVRWSETWARSNDPLGLLRQF